MRNKHYIFEKSGRKRSASYVKCAYCGVDYLKGNNQISRANRRNYNHYCSMECSHMGSRNRVQLDCAYCGTKFERAISHTKKSKSGKHFCSRECKDSAQSIYGNDNIIFEIIPDHYGDGTSDYRRNALLEYGQVCNRCGFDKHEGALQVHHIDRDRNNNNLNNLEVLCANCHLIEHRKNG